MYIRDRLSEWSGGGDGLVLAACSGSLSPCSAGYGRSPLPSSGGSVLEQPGGDHAESPGARAAAPAAVTAVAAAGIFGTGQGLHGAILERLVQLERKWINS